MGLAYPWFGTDISIYVDRDYGGRYYHIPDLNRRYDGRDLSI